MERYTITSISITQTPILVNLLELLLLYASSYYNRSHRWLALKVHDLLLHGPEAECLRSTSCWSWLSEDIDRHIAVRQRGTAQLEPFYGLELSFIGRLAIY